MPYRLRVLGLLFLLIFVMRAQVPTVGYPLGAILETLWFIYWVKQWIRLFNVVSALRQTLAHEHGV